MWLFCLMQQTAMNPTWNQQEKQKSSIQKLWIPQKVLFNWWNKAEKEKSVQQNSSAPMNNLKHTQLRVTRRQEGSRGGSHSTGSSVTAGGRWQPGTAGAVPRQAGTAQGALLRVALPGATHPWHRHGQQASTPSAASQRMETQQPSPTPASRKLEKLTNTPPKLYHLTKKWNILKGSNLWLLIG